MDGGESTSSSGGSQRRTTLATAMQLPGLDPAVQTTKRTTVVLLDMVSKLGKDGVEGDDDGLGSGGLGDK